MGHNKDVPAIAIDGLSGTGKSAVRAEVARRLGFREHDSGVLFRAIGLLAKERDVTDERGFAEIAARLDIRTQGNVVYLAGGDRTKDIRSNECGAMAARVAQSQMVHDVLRDWQLKLRQAPGLVADGRDMCHIFDTPFRFVLETSTEVRIKRRAGQLEGLGLPVDLAAIERHILDRDLADMTRKVCPYVPHPNAVLIDTSWSAVSDVADMIVGAYLRTCRE